MQGPLPGEDGHAAAEEFLDGETEAQCRLGKIVVGKTPLVPLRSDQQAVPLSTFSVPGFPRRPSEFTDRRDGSPLQSTSSWAGLP